MKCLNLKRFLVLPIINTIVFHIIIHVGIAAEKKLAQDNLLYEKTMIQNENIELDKKYRGIKARMQTMEKETIKYKQQIELLLNKANTDDELIEVLKDEIYRLKVMPKSLQKLPGNAMTVVDEAKDRNNEREIIRLQRLVKQQSEQLNTQEELIHELRRN
jgi:hypothetical protein